jgi:thioredoxin-related protein
MKDLNKVIAVLFMYMVSCISMADDFTVIDLAPAENLDIEIKAHVLTAKSLGQDIYLQLTAEWCTSCKRLSRSLNEPLMRDALMGVYVVRIDVDYWKDELSKIGAQYLGTPLFYEIADNGMVTANHVSGLYWDEDTPEKMAPILKAYFSGKYPDKFHLDLKKYGL